MQNYNVLTDVKTGARIYDKGEKKPTTVATIVWPYLSSFGLNTLSATGISN